MRTPRSAGRSGSPPLGDRAGLTLIEALIVLVVLGILAAIVIPRYASVRDRAYVATVAADLRHLAGRQEVHMAHSYAYSTDVDSLDFVPTEAVEITINEASDQGWSATGQHAAITQRRCGLYVGNADPAGGGPASQPGAIACDPDPARGIGQFLRSFIVTSEATSGNPPTPAPPP
jgi:prepilin-type N-terminal cleavage/methylation domain-containing protein